MLAVQEMFRYLRPALVPAWDQLHVWEEIEPSVLTTPCPKEVLQSAVVLAMRRSWDLFARYLTHSYYGCHRGIERRGCRRADIIGPAEYDPGHKLYTRVTKPKNAWAGPKVQHSVL